MKTPGKNDRTRVLYLSYDGLTDPLGQSQILPYLKGLSAEGYNITIVSFEKPRNYNRFKDEIKDVCKTHLLNWHPLKYHKSPPVLSTIYDLLRLKQKTKSLHKENAFTIVHCRSYLTSLVGLWAKKKYGLKFIFDMRGFWADERVEGGLWKLDNSLFKLIFNYFKRKERRFISQADHIVSLTENARNEIRSWNLGSVPVTVIPTCVDMELFTPDGNSAGQLALRKQMSCGPDDFILIYIGSWGTWYLTNEVLDFFSVLKSVNENSKLFILTPDQPYLAGYKDLSSVVVKSVSRREVPKFLNIANATVCFVKPSFSKKASSATKMAEAWAMNLSVVTNPGWGDIDMLRKQEMPLLIPALPAEYKTVAIALSKHATRSDGRQWIKGKFDLDSGIKKYNAIYRSLAHESGKDLDD